MDKRCPEVSLLDPYKLRCHSGRHFRELTDNGIHDVVSGLLVKRSRLQIRAPVARPANGFPKRMGLDVDVGPKRQRRPVPILAYPGVHDLQDFSKYPVRIEPRGNIDNLPFCPVVLVLSPKRLVVVFSVMHFLSILPALHRRKFPFNSQLAAANMENLARERIYTRTSGTTSCGFTRLSGTIPSCKLLI